MRCQIVLIFVLYLSSGNTIHYGYGYSTTTRPNLSPTYPAFVFPVPVSRPPNFYVSPLNQLNQLYPQPRNPYLADTPPGPAFMTAFKSLVESENHKLGHAFGHPSPSLPVKYPPVLEPKSQVLQYPLHQPNFPLTHPPLVNEKPSALLFPSESSERPSEQFPQ